MLSSTDFSMLGSRDVGAMVVECGTMVVGSSVGGLTVAVVVMGWSLNLTSAMCTHSIRSPDGLVKSMKWLVVLIAICRGIGTLMREVQFCMPLVRITVPILSNTLMNWGKLAPLCIVILSAPMPQAGQWNRYSSTSCNTTLAGNLNPSVTVSVLSLTVNSGAAHTKPPLRVFISRVSIVGMIPSMRTPVMDSCPIVECSPQSHAVMPDTTPTQEG